MIDSASLRLSQRDTQFVAIVCPQPLSPNGWVFSILSLNKYDRIPSPMSAILKLRAQEFEVRSGMTVRDAMIKHDIQPEVVIPTRNGELITEDEIIREGETIRLVAVISGGLQA